MTRNEKITNLVVITLLLAGAGVGGTKLFLKKLNQPAEYTFPDAIIKRWAYMDPTPGTNWSLPRFVPTTTGEWAASEILRLNRTPGLASMLADGKFYPVMSQKLVFQLVARDESIGSRRVSVFVWGSSFKDVKEHYLLDARAEDGTMMPGTIEGNRILMIPLEVRRELQNANYTLPPDSVVWLQVAFNGDKPVRHIDFTYKGDTPAAGDIQDTLDLLTRLGKPISMSEIEPNRTGAANHSPATKP
jgi:hypothetical protein